MLDGRVLHSGQVAIAELASRANSDFVESQLCLNPTGTSPPAAKTL